VNVANLSIRRLVRKVFPFVLIFILRSLFTRQSCRTNRTSKRTNEFSKDWRDENSRSGLYGKQDSRRWTKSGTIAGDWWRRCLIRISCDWPGYRLANDASFVHVSTCHPSDFVDFVLYSDDITCGRHFRFIMHVACGEGYKTLLIATRIKSLLARKAQWQ